MTRESPDTVQALPPEEAIPVRKEGRFHHGDLRMSLLAAASRAISERGDTDISLRELAKGLGVTHAATYRHFASKAELLAALATRGWERLDAVISEVVRYQLGEDEGEILRRVGERIVAFGRANSGPLRAMYLKELRYGRRFVALETASDAVRDRLVALLDEGQSRGGLRKDMPSAGIAETFLHALTGLVLGTLEATDEVAEALTAHFLEIQIAGLKPVRRPASSSPAVSERKEKEKEKKKEPVEMMTLDLFG
jgi:AcrR family transcriptional regulator